MRDEDLRHATPEELQEIAAIIEERKLKDRRERERFGR
jgi:hypothetical protein